MTQATHRRAALRARRELGDAQRQQASRRIVETVRNLREFRLAARVALFAPMPDEVDIRELSRILERRGLPHYLPIVQRDRELAFARTTSTTRFGTGPFGIREPIVEPRDLVAARDLDLVVTPLAAFDERANRIGMGGGYYDRTFEFLRHRSAWRRPKLFGVAFEAQKIEQVIANSWDVSLDAIITEAALYRPK